MLFWFGENGCVFEYDYGFMLMVLFAWQVFSYRHHVDVLAVWCAVCAYVRDLFVDEQGWRLVSIYCVYLLGRHRKGFFRANEYWIGCEAFRDGCTTRNTEVRGCAIVGMAAGRVK